MLCPNAINFWHRPARQQAEAIDHKNVLVGRHLRLNLFTLSLRDDLFSNPTSGGNPRRENDFLLVVDCRQRGWRINVPGRSRLRALNIIKAKGANLITIARQQRHCVFLREIFKL